MGFYRKTKNRIIHDIQTLSIWMPIACESRCIFLPSRTQDHLFILDYLTYNPNKFDNTQRIFTALTVINHGYFKKGIKCEVLHNFQLFLLAFFSMIQSPISCKEI